MSSDNHTSTSAATLAALKADLADARAQIADLTNPAKLWMPIRVHEEKIAAKDAEIGQLREALTEQMRVAVLRGIDAALATPARGTE